MWGNFIDKISLSYYDPIDKNYLSFNLDIFTEECGKKICVDVMPLRLLSRSLAGCKKLAGSRFIRIEQRVSPVGIYYVLAGPKRYSGYLRTVNELLSL